MKEDKVYLVMRDTGGEWTNQAIYSIWDTKDKAEKEAHRLNKLNGKITGKYGDSFWVVEVELNKQEDYNIEINFD